MGPGFRRDDEWGDGLSSGVMFSTLPRFAWPVQGAPPEAADLRQRRGELNDQIADARARLAETDLAIARAASLQQDLSRLYRQTFWGNLLERQASPLAADSLAATSADLVRVS